MNNEHGHTSRGYRLAIKLAVSSGAHVTNRGPMNCTTNNPTPLHPKSTILYRQQSLHDCLNKNNISVEVQAQAQLSETNTQTQGSAF